MKDIQIPKDSTEILDSTKNYSTVKDYHHTFQPGDAVVPEITLRAINDAEEARKDPVYTHVFDKLDRLSRGEKIEIINDNGEKEERYFQPSLFPGISASIETNYSKDIKWEPREASWKDAYSKDRPWKFQSGEWLVLSDGDATGTKVYYKGKFINGVQNFDLKIGLGEEGTTLKFEVKI